MKKNKKIILFLILNIILLISDKTYAIVVQEAPGQSYDNACSINSNIGSDVRVRVELQSISNKKNAKYGIIYKMTLGKHIVNGIETDAPAFCIDPGLGNQTTYTRGSELDPNGPGMDPYYYMVYQWYLINRSSFSHGEADMLAQALIWHLYKRQSTANLRDTMESIYYTSICDGNEDKIRKTLLNPKFSCDCFLTRPESWGKSCSSENIMDNVTGYEIDIDAYISLFTENQLNIEYNNLKGMKDQVDWMTSTGYSIFQSNEKYPGKLYIWRPTGGDSYQRLIGVYGCPPGKQKKSCVTEVEKLKKDFSVDKRKETNADYMKEIERLKEKYPEDFNTDNLADPKCEKIPEPETPACPPTYNEYACTFYDPSNNGGFYMSDAKDGDNPKEFCYLGNDIAYKTDGGEVVSSKADDLSNEYCTLYCWEAFGADFPAAIANIKAGTKFFWGRDITENMFGNLNAVRKCKTTNINYDQFIADWSANEDSISTAYSRYVDQRNFNNKNNYDKTEACTLTKECPADKVTSHTNPGGCGAGYEEISGHCYNHDQADYSDDKSCNGSSAAHTYGKAYNLPGGRGMTCLLADKAKSEPSTTYSCSQCPTGYTNSSGTSCTKAGTKFIRNAVGTAESTSACMESNSSATDIDAELDNVAELTNRQNTVSQLIGGRKTLSTKIEACQSKSVTNENSMYEYKGKVVLNYSDPAGVDRNIQSPIELENYESSTSVITNGVSSGARATRCESTPDIKDGDNCFTNNTLATYSSYEWNFTGLWYYKYSQSDFYWRSIVENAHVVNEKTYTADYSGMKIVPYELGYGIPTAFSLKTGFYEISVDVTGFGNRGTHFDKLLQEENVSVYNYACPYHVVNELYGMECNFQCDFNTRTCTLTADSPAYCDNEVKGIDLVYRVIEMASGDTKTIFPSIDGDGRNPGTNWSTFIANKNKAYKNITTPSVIYDDEPIYEIDLTPTLINQIRRDNLTYREQNMDPYTSYTDANNQEKVICEGVDTNRTCASHYITELINQNVLNGEYADCQNCGSTAERLKYINGMKERYNN